MTDEGMWRDLETIQQLKNQIKKLKEDLARAHNGVEVCMLEIHALRRKLYEEDTTTSPLGVETPDLDSPDNLPTELDTSA